MLAWLLHLHGVWIGEAGVTKALETNPQVGTENIHIKKYLKSPNKANFKSDILYLVDTDGKWLVKTALNLTTRNLWFEHFPSAIWLLPRRPIEDIVNSKMRHPGMRNRGYNTNFKRTKTHIELQEEVFYYAKYAIYINMNLICKADQDGVIIAREVIEYCGIKFRPSLYYNWVQPERWHNGS